MIKLLDIPESEMNDVIYREYLKLIMEEKRDRILAQVEPEERERVINEMAVRRKQRRLIRNLK